MPEKIIAKVIVGSQMFGTAEEGSDIDIATIYKCDMYDLIGMTYKEHDDIDKDNRRYELGKFIKLLMNANPNMLEILNAPSDCILESSWEWDLLRSYKKRFLTKKIYDTFCGYARTQIKKAKGLDKKTNWEKDRVTRKDVLDFCYVTPNNFVGAIPFKKWLEDMGWKQENIALSAISHMKDVYNFFFLPFTGVIGENSNEVRTQSIPKNTKPMGVFYCNKDGYSKHCKDYNEYEQWLHNRNENRYNVNKQHGQNFDSKNIAHNVRLLNTVKEAILGNGLKVRRSPAEVKHLLKIKHGEVSLQEIINFVEKEADEIGKLVKNSPLPDSVDFDFCNKLLIKLRS